MKKTLMMAAVLVLAGCGPKKAEAPAADTAAIAVNVDPALLRREFSRVRLVAIFRNGLGVSDDEQGARIFLATGLKSAWSHVWPTFRNYS